MKKRNWIILIVLISYILFIGYKYQIRNKDVQSEHTRELKVVTSFYPMYMHTKAIMQGSPHEVINMASQTVGCLHDYQLTVQDAKKLYDADILIINGLGSETFIEKAYKQNENLVVIDASHEIEKQIELEEEHIHDVHNHEEEEHDHEHDHEHINDHIWLSIEGSMMQIEQIANELIKADPDHASLYEKNAKAYKEALVQLDKAAHDALEDTKGLKAVSVHDAFEYLASDLGIDIIETIPEGSYENASAKQIEALIEHMKEENVKVILTEAKNKDLAILDTIQSELNCKVYVIDALVTENIDLDLTSEEGFEYVKRMEKNIEILREAFRYE